MKSINKGKSIDIGTLKETIPDQKEMAKLIKSINKGKSIDIGTLKDDKGNDIVAGKGTIEELIKTHFPYCTEKKRITYSRLKTIDEVSLCSKYKDWIDANKVRSAMNGFQGKKSPGPDGLKPLIFEHFPSNVVQGSYTFKLYAKKMEGDEGHLYWEAW
jgi:hypothetical protein